MTCAMEVGAVRHRNQEWLDFAQVLSALRHVPCLQCLRLQAWVPRGPALGPLERCLRMAAACLPQLRTLALVVQEFKHQVGRQHLWAARPPWDSLVRPALRPVPATHHDNRSPRTSFAAKLASMLMPVSVRRQGVLLACIAVPRCSLLGVHPYGEGAPADSFPAVSAGVFPQLDPLGQHILEDSYTVLSRRAAAGWRAARAADLQGADLDTWQPAASTAPATPNDSPASSPSAPPSAARKLVPSLAPLASLPCLSRLELHVLPCEPFGVCGQAEREVRQLLLGVGGRRLGVWCPQLSRRAARELSRLALELQGGAAGGGAGGSGAMSGEFEWRVDCSPPADSVDLGWQGGAVEVMSGSRGA